MICCIAAYTSQHLYLRKTVTSFLLTFGCKFCNRISISKSVNMVCEIYFWFTKLLGLNTNLCQHDSYLPSYLTYPQGVTELLQTWQSNEATGDDEFKFACSVLKHNPYVVLVEKLRNKERCNLSSLPNNTSVIESVRLRCKIWVGIKSETLKVWGRVT
jgi:hypothetical protein